MTAAKNAPPAKQHPAQGPGNSSGVPGAGPNTTESQPGQAGMSPPSPVSGGGAGGEGESTKRAAPGKIAAITVTCAREGFRRGGRAWFVAPVTVPVADFTDEQLAQIRAEPLLTVEDVEIDAAAD